MYQMMIIDDEPMVREGLKQLLPWDKLGFTICVEGTDGKDGLAKVLEFDPDLVLVDVKMPGMTGIELIREAKKQGFNGKFIILTGYSDFEFAKTAVSLGVRAYILKPIDEDELQNNINEVLLELEAARNLEAYYGQNELKAKQELMRRLLLYVEDKEVLRKEIKPYGVDFRYRDFCVAILTNRSRQAAQEPGESNFVERMDSLLKGMERTEKVPLEDDRWALIGKGYRRDEFEQKLIQGNEKVKVLFGTGFFILVGHCVANWEDIHFSYECACMLESYQFLYDTEAVVTLRLLLEAQSGRAGLSVEQMMHLIELGDQEGIGRLEEQFAADCRKNLQKGPEIKIWSTHSMTQMHNLILGRYEQKKAEFPDIEELTEEIKNSVTVYELGQILTKYCRQMSTIIGASSSDNVVRRMYAYMEKNYDKDLKLEMISTMFNYNSAYLGKIFKKEMGESFNNALDHIRISSAKRLLTDTSLKVYQVSERVGFSNIDYFYSKFKRYVGISPKEFKRQVEGKQTEVEHEE